MKTRREGPAKSTRKTSKETFLLMRALMNKIRCQFPDTPEGRLMLAVINCALSDLLSNRTGLEVERNRRNAAHYLAGNIWHAYISGIDAEWIHLQLRRAGVVLSAERAA